MWKKFHKLMKSNRIQNVLRDFHLMEKEDVWKKTKRHRHTPAKRNTQS